MLVHILELLKSMLGSETMMDSMINKPFKQHLKEQLIKVSAEIQDMLSKFDCNDDCILSEFEQIQNKLSTLQKTAALFYLNNYLSPYTSSYQEISTAIQHFSDLRQGALIAVERTDSLEPYLHSGIPIGGYVSSALLETIFYPGGRLHDGAVLIKEDTIISAANVLPVSKQDSGGKKLGTRHRAAIGLSELTDALVLVVSEETGRASFALAGKLYPINA